MFTAAASNHQQWNIFIKYYIANKFVCRLQQQQHYYRLGNFFLLVSALAYGM
jgi:hypothetical protein